jgi:putative MATE family efflux protein
MAQAQTISPALDDTQPLRARVFKLALPAVGEQALNTLVGLADIYLVGNLSLQAAASLGYDIDAALNSVGLGNQMVWLMMVFFMAAGIGSTATIARATGAGDEEGKQRFLRQSMLIALAVGLLSMAAVFIFARPFLGALGAGGPQMSPHVLPRGVEYLHIIGLSLIPASLLFIGTACMRGAGDTRTPLYVMLGVNTVNVFITWLLVSGQMGLPALGVAGAAIGTAVARSGGGAVVVWLLLRGRSGLRLDFNLQPHLETIQRLVRIGLPTAGEMLVFHGALLIFTRFVTSLGTEDYAAHITTITIESLSFLPGLGYGVAASALVGQALGARTPQRAEQMGYEALWQGMAFMTLMGAIMVLLPDVLMRLFVNDPAVVAVGTAPLRAAGLVQPALAVGFILNGALRGAGDTKWPLYSRLFTTWGIRLPVTLLLVGMLGFGLNAIWLAMCIDFSCQAMLSLWRFNSGYWKSIEV